MRRLAGILLLLALAGGSAACCGPQKAFVEGVEQSIDAILPEYETYVDRDPALSPETKKIRKETSVRLKALVEQAKKDH